MAVINFAVMMIGYTVCNHNVTDCSYTPMAGNTPKFSNTFIYLTLYRLYFLKLEFLKRFC